MGSKIPKMTPFVYVKDNAKGGEIYKVFELDNDKKAQAADEVFEAEWDAYEKDPDENPVPAPHKYANQYVKMSIDADYWYYYGATSSPRQRDDGMVKNWGVKNLEPINDRDKVSLLERKIEGGWGNSFHEGAPTREEAKYLDSLSDKFEAQVSQEEGRSVTPGIPLYMYAKDATFKKHIDSVVRMWLESFFNEEPTQRRSMDVEYFKTDFTAMLAAQDFASEYFTLKEKVDKYRADLLKTTFKDAPVIPMLKKGTKLYPHQALAIATLDKTRTGVIDVDMGGGKTLIILADILNLLNKGDIKRPCIIMPQRLIPQQIAEMQDWSGDRLNFLPLLNKDTWGPIRAKAPLFVYDEEGKKRKAKTKTEINRAREDYAFQYFADMIKKCPPNTIIVASYEWIRTGFKEEVEVEVVDEITGKKSKIKQKGDAEYERGLWLREQCGVDYVALDESHKIKNFNSSTSKSVADLSRVKYKRISTGTLTPNKLDDMWRQISWLDAGLFGSYKEFVDTYAASTTTSSLSGKGEERPLDYVPGAQKDMRAKVLELGAVFIRRSHWIHLLPRRFQVPHQVKLSKAQKDAYDLIFQGIMSEIETDDTLRALWEKMKKSDDDDEVMEEVNFSQILQRLVRLDQFLTAPESFNGKDIVIKLKDGGEIKKKLRLPPGEEVSPKIAITDRLLDEHFADPKNGKVIIFCQNLASAEHFKKHLKRSEDCIYYDAQHSSNLNKFMIDPKIRILCAADGSLKHGFNLQMANRIIRADLHWTPGDMEQTYGRIFRAGQKREVFIDVLITDDTAEVTKYARLISKAHSIAQFNSDFTDDVHVPVVSMGEMETFRYFTQLDPYEVLRQKIQDHEIAENKVYRESYGDSMIEDIVKSGTEIKGSKMVTNLPILKSVDDYILAKEKIDEIGAGGDALTVWLSKRPKKKPTTPYRLIITESDSSAIDVSVLKKLGWKYTSDYHGIEVYYKWFKDELSVKQHVKILKDELGVAVNTIKGSPHKEDVSNLAPEIGEDGKIVEKVEEDKVLDLTLFNLDGYFYLRVPRDEDSLSVLKSKYDFTWDGRWYMLPIKSRAHALTNIVAQVLKSNIDITNLDGLVQEIKTNRALPKMELPRGLISTMIRVPPKQRAGHIEMFFGQLDGVAHLYVVEKEAKADLAVLKRLKFRLDPASYVRWFKKMRDIPKFLKGLAADGYKVRDYDGLIRGLKKAKLSISGLDDLRYEEEEGKAEEGASGSGRRKPVEADYDESSFSKEDVRSINTMLNTIESGISKGVLHDSLIDRIDYAITLKRT